MLSKRSMLSFSQLLGLFAYGSYLPVLFAKHGIADEDAYIGSEDDIRAILREATHDQLTGLLDELARTLGDFRSRTSPKYRFDERWRDLQLCLSLDGYRLGDGSFHQIEPTIEGVESLEDDLTTNLNESGIGNAAEVVRLINSSAERFTAAAPDYNQCLGNIRVALETLAREIALVRQPVHPGSYDPTKWGQVVAYLRKSGFLSVEEEKGVAGVYTFVSPGSHRPVGVDEQEMARLGRNLALGMCYFLVKRYQGSSSASGRTRRRR